MKAITNSAITLDYWSNNFRNELLVSENRGIKFYNFMEPLIPFSVIGYYNVYDEVSYHLCFFFQAISNLYLLDRM